MRKRERRAYDPPTVTAVAVCSFAVLTGSDVDAGSDIHDWDSGEGGSGNIEI